MIVPASLLPTPVVHACSHWQEELQYVTQQVASLYAAEENANVAIVAANFTYRNQIACQLLEKGVPFVATDNVFLQHTPLVAQVYAIATFVCSELHFPNSGDHALYQILHMPMWQIPKTCIAELTASVAAQQYKANAKGLLQQLMNTIRSAQQDLFGTPPPEGLLVVYNLLKQWLLLAKEGATLLALMTQVIQKLQKHPFNQGLPQWQLTALHHWMQLVKQTFGANQLPTPQALEVLQEAMYQQLPPCEAASGKYITLGYWNQLPDAHAYTKVILVGAQLLKQSNNLLQWQSWWQQAVSPAAQWHLYFETPLPASSPWLALALPYAHTPNVLPWLATLQQSHPTIEQAFLKKFVLSATTFNTFLRCPIQFYYQYVLKVPTAGNAAMHIGVALHKALENWYTAMLLHPDKTFPPILFLLASFENAMRQQEANFVVHSFADYLQKGKTILTNYYHSQMPISNQSVVVERMLQKIYLGGVPAKGKIDKLVFEGASVVIVDYKSGSVAKAMASLQPPTEQQPLGGDYWRQALFYLLLVRAAMPNKQVDTVVFDFLEPNQLQEYYQHTIVANNEQLKEVQQQIASVWQQIQQKNWRTGCGKMHCQWCHMARVYNW